MKGVSKICELSRTVSLWAFENGLYRDHVKSSFFAFSGFVFQSDFILSEVRCGSAFFKSIFWVRLTIFENSFSR